MTIEAVIFDWGGTLTPWQEFDGQHWQRIVARLGYPPASAAALEDAENAVWRRCRDEHRSATLADLFAAGGIEADEAAYEAVKQEWEPASHLDPQASEMLRALRSAGLRLGLLSNTVWPRRMHEAYLARDGIIDLFDGCVYSCEIPWTKPHPAAFEAVMQTVGVSDPRRCVFVGDRLFDDIHGGSRAGMRTVHIPHSAIPAYQRGHTDGQPDAVIERLSDLPALISNWAAAHGPHATDSGFLQRQ